MKQTATHVPAVCDKFHSASELIGRRWTGAVIWVLLKQRCRFRGPAGGDPGHHRPDAERTASGARRRRGRRANGVPETPVRVEYALTKKGKALATAMEAIGGWAEKYM